MSLLDRVVGGVACRDVLSALSDYLDGELPADRVAAIEAHLAGCDRCERFGGRFGAVVGALRSTLRDPDPPLDVRRRLRRRLAEEAGG